MKEPFLIERYGVVKKEKILINIIIVCIVLPTVKICSDIENLYSNLGSILSSFVLIIIAGVWFGLPFSLLYKLFEYKGMRIFCSVVLGIFFVCQSMCCFFTVMRADYENYYIGQCISSGITIGILFARKKAYKKLDHMLDEKQGV